MAQAVGHGVIFPRLAGDKYSPGFLASALLHVPIGITYIKAVQADRRLARAEWAAAIAYTVIFAAVGVYNVGLCISCSPRVKLIDISGVRDPAAIGRPCNGGLLALR